MQELTQEHSYLSDMARQQAWGFICPGLNLLLPYLTWRKHKSTFRSPTAREAAQSLLDFQLSWSLYLLLPLLCLVPILLSPSWAIFYNEYEAFVSGYSLLMPDFSILAIPIAWLTIMIMIKFTFVAIWAGATIKIRKQYQQGDYEYNGILKLKFFRKG